MSFSGDTKSTLASEPVGKICCLTACLAGMLHFSPITDENVLTFKTDSKEVSEMFAHALMTVAGVQAEAKRVGTAYKTELSGESFEKIRHLTAKAEGGTINRFFSCRKCDNMFFRGAFLASGFVNPPDKPGRVELSTIDADVACDSATALTRHFRLPKLSVRRGNQIIYYRDTESIEYFLSYIGAVTLSFELINDTILKETRAVANRQKNCDTTNIMKTLGAAERQTDAIMAIIEHGALNELPQPLRRTAQIRLENPIEPLDVITELHEGEITRSGVNHRLARIVKYAEKKGYILKRSSKQSRRQIKQREKK